MRKNNCKFRYRRGAWLLRGGLLLIAAALLLTAYNLWDEWQAGQASGRIIRQIQKIQEKPENNDVRDSQEIPDYVLNPDMEMPVVEIDGNQYIGTLEIPDLGISLPVMSQWSYPRLRIAPCRYDGSVYKGNMVIAAHNYRTHFGQLGRLFPGDKVVFIDMDGNRFTYRVAEIQVLEPSAVDEMTSQGWSLSLFTCTLGGTSRLTVRCMEVENLETAPN